MRVNSDSVARGSFKGHAIETWPRFGRVRPAIGARSEQRAASGIGVAHSSRRPFVRQIYHLAAACCGLLAPGASVGDVSRPVVAQVQALEQSDHGSERQGCTLRRLRSTYAVLATGTVVTPPPGSGIPAGPFATVGTLAVDRDGNAVLNATRSFNGQIIAEEDLPGTLTLNDDCTGSAAFQGPRTFNFVVLDDHREMHTPARWSPS